MAPENNRRPKRTPLTKEELASVIAYKKRQELHKKIKFKKSFAYRFFNLFNVLCFFTFIELLFCFFVCGNYKEHLVVSATARFGDEHTTGGQFKVEELHITDELENKFDLTVNDFIQLPEKNSQLLIGRDFILQKELTAKFETSESNYMLYSSGPYILLSLFSLIVTFIVYSSNYNETAYSLRALSILNGMILVSILCMG